MTNPIAPSLIVALAAVAPFVLAPSEARAGVLAPTNDATEIAAPMAAPTAEAAGSAPDARMVGPELPPPATTPTSVEPVAEVPAVPVETAPPPAVTVTVAPVPAFVPAPAAPAFHVPQAPSRGRGMIIGAVVLGSLGGALRIATTILATQGDPVFTIVTGSFFYNPLLATSLGLAGGGMARRGQYDAHGELFLGRAPTRPRRAALGWGLFGAGVGVWALTRGAGLFLCGTEECAAGVFEVGYYASLAGTVPGVVMGSYASGYNGYRKRFGHLAELGIAPVAHRNAWGLSLSGRF